MAQQTLLTWKLIPSSKASALWDLSIYRGVAVARARDAIQARQIAASYFRKRGGASNVISRIESPWYIQSLVTCQLFDGTAEIDRIDVPGIVDPHGLDGARFASSARA